MRDEDYEGKILVFNPAGFILKIILAVIAIIWLKADTTQEVIDANGGIIFTILEDAMYVLTIWFMATLFGFCLKATGNYIIAFVLMFILLILLGIVVEWINGKGKIASIAASVVFVVALIWLPINDIRKAILYFKNTI